ARPTRVPGQARPPGRPREPLRAGRDAVAEIHVERKPSSPWPALLATVVLLVLVGVAVARLVRRGEAPDLAPAPPAPAGAPAGPPPSETPPAAAPAPSPEPPGP